MIKVQEYIEVLVKEKLTTVEIGDRMGVSQPMVSQYKRGYHASLNVAIKVYRDEGITLFPFAKEALKELSDEG